MIAIAPSSRVSPKREMIIASLVRMAEHEKVVPFPQAELPGVIPAGGEPGSTVNELIVILGICRTRSGSVPRTGLLLRRATIR